MSKHFLFFFVACSLTASAAEQPKTVSSGIKEVEAFLSGAIITRTAKPAVDPGTTELVFDKLPGTIDRNNIGVTGTGSAVILSVVHRLNYLDPEKKNPELKKLETILDTLNRNLDEMLDKKSVYTEEQSMLLANKATGGANIGVTSDNLEEVADLFRRRLTELKDKLTDLKYKEKKLREEIDKYNRQLADANAKYSQPTSAVVVTVSAKERTTVNLELTYYVPNAGWKPMYDLRAKDSSSPLSVNFKADIFQSTGEDWDDVKLTLSTGNPTSGGTKPELQPWYLDYLVAQTFNKNRYNMNAPAAAGAEARSEMAQTIAMNDMQTIKDFVTENSSRFIASFTIERSYSVPSDGKYHTAEIKRFTMNSEYIYFAAPKLDKDAFLVARTTGWGDLNLLPGEGNVYFEGSFVGTTFINTASTDDTLDVSLGRDKRIVITREKNKDVSGSTGIFGSNKSKQLAYTISLRNTRKEAVKLILEDQVPVSKQKDIEVKINELSDGELNSTTGKVIWKLDLPAGETVKKNISFTVKYPKDKTISNL
ncbi:MAG TPA: mucoidy inhibitor MuiA family protein [Bacteroidia bacterium]|nr:mucoidy inhibitor MuiA family protein [Bacteroidia bacterium]